MNPITHLLVSWAMANGVDVEERDRALITLSGIAPDIDGLGAVAGFVSGGTAGAQSLFEAYHHQLGHNLPAGIVVAALCFALARRRWITAAMSLAAFHVHLLCDLVGARGPDGFSWPFPYLAPFSKTPQLQWSGQWCLVSWQNLLITVVFLALMFRLAWSRGYSLLEILSRRMDHAFVAALRQRFPRPAPRSDESSPAPPGHREPEEPGHL